ncbi:hypothetical protein C7N83_10530 [Neisseria iguanae]|uniref:Uncharacterized protein n=1 Tax=Neisseria iguanae TaxID=90242 RepID=A0A2P7TYB4_9NEIS|nr:hypothetical protein C7N83_10530 [Neisseria iguanae]
MYEQEILRSRQILLSHDLERTFNAVWAEVCATAHRLNLAIPFWSLQPKVGWEDGFANKNKMKSSNVLKQAVEYAEIDEPLQFWKKHIVDLNRVNF